MSFGNLVAAQIGFSDSFEALFPGQLAESVAIYSNKALNRFSTQTAVFVGRGVVQGDVFDPAVTLAPNQNPAFRVQAPLIASVDGDFVGIAVRNANVVQNSPGTPSEAIYGIDRIATIATRGDGTIIGAQTTVAITEGDDVYMAVNPVNAASIGVGEFTNAAGAGLIQILGTSWIGSALANTVARIRL